jgi:hypothetical protein
VRSGRIAQEWLRSRLGNGNCNGKGNGNVTVTVKASRLALTRYRYPCRYPHLDRRWSSGRKKHINPATYNVRLDVCGYKYRFHYAHIDSA